MAAFVGTRISRFLFALFFSIQLYLWSAICFKIMTRYTCGFSHVYLQSFLLHDIRAFFCHVYLRFIPKYMTTFLQTSTYTAISRKVVGKKVPATIPKGNMGYDQYTVSDTVAVEPTFAASL